MPRSRYKVLLSVECCDSLTKLLCIEVGLISSQFTRRLSSAAVCQTLVLLFKL